VLVNNGRIAVLGKTGSFEAPAEARVIDGAGLTVLPGLIDSHGHLYGGWRGGNDSGLKPTYVKWQLLTYL
jgi:imidazolonepropionase-like amidohydrolase